jgi:cell division protein FtsQ
MKFRKVLKYLLFPALMVGLGFLYSFSSTRNLQIKIAEPIVEFEEGDNNFLTYSMVNKLLIQNKETVQNQAKSVINL